MVRSLAAGGPVSTSASAQNAGSETLYAGLAGTLDGGAGLGGHVFSTTAAQLATNTTAWADLAKNPVANDTGNGGVFNPAGFDISSVAADPHDATGATVYATLMGFSGHPTSSPHVYRSVDAGAHWTQISANLPNAPANSVLVDPNDANTVYIALDTGVYVTTQVTTCATANCWSVYGTALPNAPVIQLLAAATMPTGDGRYGMLRAGTYGRGIWQVPLVTAISPAAPAITLSPTMLTYAAQAQGTISAAQAVTVTNTGNAALTVSSVTSSGDFNESDNCTSAPIAVGASCTVQVSFLPTATGTRTGLLTVYGNVAGGQATATLTGIGTAPAAIVLTPITVAFPATTVGATSAAINIVIANTGGTVSKLATPMTVGDFRISANTCGATLSPGTSCTVGVVFAPVASGTRSGTFSVTDDAGTQVAALTGTGTSPATDALSVTSLSFPATVLNSASAGQQVTLINSGDVALTLIAASIASGDFTVVNGCGSSLNAHSSCALTVAFAPKSLGAQTGSLAVADQFRTQSIALTGTGLAPAGVSLAPTGGLAFAATGVGLSATAQTVTLTNNGGVALAIGGFTVMGDFALLTGGNTCGATLAPAAVCTLQVGFSPTLPGARTGLLSVQDSAGNSPQMVALSGAAVDFSLAVNGPSSATLASGGTATYSLLLSSAAGVSGTAAFTCSGVPAHATCTVNPGTPSLGGATPMTVTVATGLASGSLSAPPMPGRSASRVWFALLLPGALLCFFRGKRRALALCLSYLVIAVAGCGSSRTLPGSGGSGTTPVVTPSGTYTLLVAGASTGLVRSVSLTLVVQ